MKKQTQLIRSDTDYAMRMLVYLALWGAAKPVLAATLSETQGVPMEFAEKILRRLVKAGLLRSSRGRGGGFILAQNPKQISLLAVMEAVQGPLMVRQCLLDDDACPAHPSCPVSTELRKLQESLRKSMQRLTLARIMEARRGNAL